jgi:hypothetical protein
MAKKKDPPAVPMSEDERPKELQKEEKDWGARLVRAKQFQKKYATNWEENRRLIFGDFQSGENVGQTPPWMGTTGNTVAYGWGLYAGLETTIYVQNPDVIATARDMAGVPIARRLTQILKYDFEQMNAKDIGNLCLLDTFINGYGAVIEDVTTDHEYEEDEENEGQKKKTGNVRSQEFELRRIDPRDILFDKTARRLDLSDCKYIFTAWYPTIEELREDPDITDLPDNIESFPEASEYSRAQAVPEGPAERQAASLVHGPGTGEKDPAYKTICVWEVYDKVNHEVLYLTDAKHYIIGKREWPVNLRFGCRDLYPITLLYQHPVPGRFYPRPEAELIAPQLREINITERIISEDSRTKWRKYVTLSGIFSEDQKSKITDTTVANSLLFVDGSKISEALGGTQQLDPGGFDINRLVAQLQDVSPARDLMPRYAMLEQEIFHIVGYGPNQRGGLPSTRSAREAMMINSEKERKLDKRRDRITDFYRYLAMKHTRFLQKYMVVERYAKAIPKAGEMSPWITYNRDDITGEFAFDVVAGSSVPKNTEVRKAAEQQLFQTVMPMIIQLGLDPRPAFFRLAEFMDWDNVDEIFSGLMQAAEQATVAAGGFAQGKVPPEQLLNSYAQFSMAALGQARIKMLQQQMTQQPMAQVKGQRGDTNPQGTTAGTMPGGAP